MSELTTQIAVLETQMKTIAKQVDEGFSNNSKEHKDIIKTNQENFDEIINRFEKAMEKKADRWVQNVIVWMGAAIGGVIIVALMSLIIIR